MSGLASFLWSFLPPKDGDKENYDYQESIANVVSKEDAPPADSPPPDPRTESAAEWRAQRNEGLRLYMEKRMVAPDNDEEEQDDDNSEDYIVPDNDEGNVPFWDEQAVDSQPTDTSTTSPSVRRKKYPHIDETVHIAKTLTALDLYAREFHLSLGLVEKVWPLRAIPRRSWKTSSNFEDDGPLATLFKQVVSVEVTQLSQNAQVANLAQAAFQARSPQRLKIFFYNKYATQISSLLERQHVSRVLLSLHNIPAKCILPLNVENFSWYDSEGLAPYCLCIGDKSSMKLEQDGVLVKIPFDVPDLKVTVARIVKDKVTEVDLTPDSARGELELKEKDSLEAAYQEWEKAQQEAENTQEEEQEEEPQESEADAGTSGKNSTRSADAATNGRAAKKARTEETYHTLVSSHHDYVISSLQYILTRPSFLAE